MSGEQAPAPASPGRNPRAHNNNAEREPNGFLPIRAVAAGLIELLSALISHAHPYGRTRRSIFDHGLPLTGSRRQRTTGRALQLDQAVGRLETDLPLVVYSARCHRVSFWLASTPRTK